MAQAYITTYTNDFRWHPIEKRVDCKPVDKYAESFPEGDIWIKPDEDEGGQESITTAERLVRQMLRNRLWSTYQVSYCKDQMPKKGPQAEKSFENELLEYCTNLYGERLAKVPVPLPTTRRLFAYQPERFMYVPLTTYQHHIGRIGYNTLRENYERTEALPKPKLKC